METYTIAYTAGLVPPPAPRPPAEPTLHRVELLRGPVIVGNRVHSAGDLVEVDERRARLLHADGSGRILEPGAIKNLPPAPLPPMPRVFVDPFPDDPRVTVKVTKGTPIWGDRVLQKGDSVSLPERIAAGWLASNSAALARGQALSERGVRYLRDLSQSNHSVAAY